jgi:hypothetical protein
VPNWAESLGGPSGVSVNVHVVGLLHGPNAGHPAVPVATDTCPGDGGQGFHRLACTRELWLWSVESVTKIPTTTIGSFPKPDYVSVRDWFPTAV